MVGGALLRLDRLQGHPVDRHHDRERQRQRQQQRGRKQGSPYADRQQGQTGVGDATVERDLLRADLELALVADLLGVRFA